MEKYYFAGTNAEGYKTAIVHLTESEHAAVVKFIDQLYENRNILRDEGYSGDVYIDDDAFDSFSDAHLADIKR